MSGRVLAGRASTDRGPRQGQSWGATAGCAATLYPVGYDDVPFSRECHPDECAIRSIVAERRKVRRRSAGVAQGGSGAVARRGPLHRRSEPAQPVVCGHGAQPDGAWHDQQHRCRDCPRNARGAGRDCRRGPRCRRHRQHAGCREQAPRWFANAPAAAASVGDGARPLCRRTDRDGGGGNRQAGEGRGRGGVRRHRSIAGGDDRRCGRGPGCTAGA